MNLVIKMGPTGAAVQGKKGGAAGAWECLLELDSILWSVGEREQREEG